MKIRVIIPFYKGQKFIQKCLESLQILHTRIIEVVIIDNDPKGLLIPKELQHNEFYALTIIKVKPKIGFGRACNIGIDYLKNKDTDILILLNQDTIVDKNCFMYLSEELCSSQNAFAATPLSLDYKTKIASDFTIRHYIAKNKSYINDLILNKETKKNYTVSPIEASGSCIAINCSNLSHVGLFDPSFWMYGEETDLFQRGKNAGYDILFVPKAKIFHYHTNPNAHDNNAALIKALARHGNQIRSLKNPCNSIPMSIMRTWVFSIRSFTHALLDFRFIQIVFFMLFDLKLIISLPVVLSSRRSKVLEWRTKRKIIEDKNY
jgi:GT2 family glycosyltransferase